MITKIVLSAVGILVNWFITILGVFPQFPSEALPAVTSYISTVLRGGCGLVFFLIRPQTFFNALDVCLILWKKESIYYFTMWLIKKIPFLGIK